MQKQTGILITISGAIVENEISCARNEMKSTKVEKRSLYFSSRKY